MKVYVVNLKTSLERRSYIEKLLQRFGTFFETNVVEAVDGRYLPDDELGKIWDQNRTYRNYGRYMSGGEIGCSLSHRKCYEEILKNGDDMAMVIEDDVSFQEENVREVVAAAEKVLRTSRPVIILLTGSYWYMKKKDLPGTRFSLAGLYEGMGTVAYMINNAAAKILDAAPRAYLADDWYNIRSFGITVYAVNPHIAGDVGLFVSDIFGNYQGAVRKNLGLCKKLQLYRRGLMRRFLGRIGHWEKRAF